MSLLAGGSLALDGMLLVVICTMIIFALKLPGNPEAITWILGYVLGLLLGFLVPALSLAALAPTVAVLLAIGLGIALKA